MNARTLRGDSHRYYSILVVFLLLVAGPQVAEASDECENVQIDTCSPLPGMPTYSSEGTCSQVRKCSRVLGAQYMNMMMVVYGI